MLALPCGSKSITSTDLSIAAIAVARLTAVVVLPTPPFWLVTAITRDRLRAADSGRSGRPSVIPFSVWSTMSPRGNIRHLENNTGGVRRASDFFDF